MKRFTIFIKILDSQDLKVALLKWYVMLYTYIVAIFILYSGEESRHNFGAQGHQFFPPNYGTCFEFVKLVSKAMLVILGLGRAI